MLFAAWLRTLKARVQLSQASPSRPSRKRRPRARLALLLLEDRVVPSAYVVTTTADSGPGSLRDAINQINADPSHVTYASPSNPSVDEIDFNITAASDTGTGYNATTAVATIQPVAELPFITTAVIINGYTQPGATVNTLATGDNAVLKIDLDGSQYTGGSALRVNVGNVTITGLCVSNFQNGDAIGITGSNIVITGNFLGTDVTGSNPEPDDGGVGFGPGSGDIVGGTDPALRNIVSGTTSGFGSLFLEYDTGAVVQGNYIGTDHTGTRAIGNWIGIWSRGSNNVIGGTAPGAGNVISGNADDGIYIDGPAGTLIEGNLIGTDTTGTAALGNGLGVSSGVGDGIEVHGTSAIIGGTTPGAGNLISGNTDGIFTDGLGSVVQGNLIGTDKTGTKSLGNTRFGVHGFDNSLIGGTTAAARNIISGNGVAGIQGAGSVIEGNYIGTDITGTQALGNGRATDGDSGGVVCWAGVNFNSPALMTIGGTAAGAGNVISGNSFAGILLQSSNNLIVGNLIGTDYTGTQRLGNVSGIGLVDSSNNTIVGNVIAASLNAGIALDNSAQLDQTGNVIAANFIGTNAAGATNLGNNLGVYAQHNAGSLVGGTTPVQANVITNNFLGVVYANTANLAILGNSIFDNAGHPDSVDRGGIRNDTPAVRPVLTSAINLAAGAIISGAFQGAANTTYRIEFFANQGLDVLGDAEGQTFLGYTMVTTDGSGNAAFTNVNLPAIPAGQTYVTATATVAAANGDGSYTYGYTSEFSDYITPTRPAPANLQLSLQAPSINENDVASLSGSFVDPNPLDTYTVLINWGDGSANSIVNLAAGVTTFSGITHRYLDNPAAQPNGSYSINVTVTDSEADETNAQTSIQVNNVAPSFSFPLLGAPVSYFTGGAAVAAADFRQDGKVDLAAVVDTGISVLLNNGNGTFANPVRYQGDVPGLTALAVGDFNGDGYPDIVDTASWQRGFGNDYVDVFLNNGDGTFRAGVSYAVGPTVTSVAVGDFNGARDVNGKPILDLAATCIGTSSVYVLLGNGDGTFQAAKSYPCDASPRDLAVGDFNGAQDSHGNPILDIVTANAHNGDVSILMGNGDGTFQAPQNYATPNGDDGVVVAALKPGGPEDIIVGGNGVGVLIGNGDGTFRPEVGYATTSGQQVDRVAVADLNRDGNLDVVASSFVTGGAVVPGAVNLLLGNGDGTLQSVRSYNGGISSHSMAVGDFNGDGQADVAVGSGIVTSTFISTSNFVSVLMNNGQPLSISASRISENGSVSLSGHFTDPGTLDTHSVTINWGDGSANTTINLAAGVLNFSGISHQYLDNPAGQTSGSYTISVTVTDKDGGSGSATTSVEVDNVAPSNVQLSLGAASINQGAAASLSGSFTDPGTLDTHTVDINWGDGSPDTTLNLAAGVLTFSGIGHPYLTNSAGLPGGTFPITVAITDKDGGSGTGATAIQVNNVVTRTALTSSANPSVWGQTVTFTATVSAVSGVGTPSGSVDFVDTATGTDLGSVRLSGGTASLTITSLAVGSHTIDAIFSGDVTFLGSSDSLAQVVNQAPTVTMLAVSAATPLFGVDSVTFTATVTGAPGGFTGSVDFFDATTSTDLGSIPLASGTGALTTGALAVGSHTIVATYSGDANFLSSQGSTSLTVLAPDSLSGIVFEDFNNDGQVDFGEEGISGVAITLSGTDDLGHTVSRSRLTDGDGAYLFLNLRPGNYYITETQPAGYLQGVDSVGTAGGRLVATDQFFVQLGQGINGLNYNYGEQPPAGGAVRAGQAASIGFWNNKNGQALILALNGGGTSTQLGNWLAATLPDMFGVYDGGTSLAGKSNAYIATLFQSDFLLKGVKLDAQVLATALSVYVTNATLDATGVAGQHGFLVSADGLGTATINVGSNGAAFGVADDTTMTVLDLLFATDAQAVNGVLYDGDAILRKEANAVYSVINQGGNIG